MAYLVRRNMSILSRLSELFGYKVTIEKIGENKNKEKPANKTASNSKNKKRIFAVRLEIS